MHQKVSYWLIIFSPSTPLDIYMIQESCNFISTFYCHLINSKVSPLQLVEMYFWVCWFLLVHFNYKMRGHREIWVATEESSYFSFWKLIFIANFILSHYKLSLTFEMFFILGHPLKEIGVCQYEIQVMW